MGHFGRANIAPLDPLVPQPPPHSQFLPALGKRPLSTGRTIKSILNKNMFYGWQLIIRRKIALTSTIAIHSYSREKITLGALVRQLELRKKQHQRNRKSLSVCWSYLGAHPQKTSTIISDTWNPLYFWQVFYLNPFVNFRKFEFNPP